jgi:histidyl-tRNA synthetase
MQFRAVKGMNDILPGEVERWQRLEQAFRRTVELHGYEEIRTPFLEALDLFVRSTGQTSEIVEKQMFELERGGERLALRPEGTPGAARAFINSSGHAQRPVTRWYYLGPMFRAEQPQRGRYRQFHQAGCEVYGDPGPVIDAEIIDMLSGLLRGLGIQRFEVHLNSLGGAASRARYRDALLRFLEPKRDALSEHAQKRLLDNPLRILDSKDPRDRAAVQGAPSVLDELEPEDRAHFEGLRRALDALGTSYVVDAGLVRGLDYYTRTLFEITAEIGELGSQNALLGGGRYDGMLTELGGPALPAIGFAIGLERILLALGETELPRVERCFVVPIGEKAVLEGLRLGRELRDAGIPTEVDGRGGSVKSMLRRADNLGARFSIVIGDGELQRGTVQLKDLPAHTQLEVPRAEVLASIQKVLGSGEAGR